MVLEKVVSSLLERVLGEFVEGFDGHVNLSLFSTTSGIELKNLRVKKDALNAIMPLPVQVQSGTVGRVKLSVPWSSLLSKPTVIAISDIYAVAAPSNAYNSSFDAQKAA
jgi:hypothetical protein